MSDVHGLWFSHSFIQLNRAKEDQRRQIIKREFVCNSYISTKHIHDSRTHILPEEIPYSIFYLLRWAFFLMTAFSYLIYSLSFNLFRNTLPPAKDAYSIHGTTYFRICLMEHITHATYTQPFTVYNIQFDDARAHYYIKSTNKYVLFPRLPQSMRDRFISTVELVRYHFNGNEIRSTNSINVYMMKAK